MNLPPFPAPDAKLVYGVLQREAREAIDSCADSLAPVMVSTPSNPDEPQVPLDTLLRRMLMASDARLSSRVLMVIAEAARQQDAVALFIVERLATHYAAHEAQRMIDAGLIAEAPHAA